MVRFNGKLNHRLSVYLSKWREEMRHGSFSPNTQAAYYTYALEFINKLGDPRINDFQDALDNLRVRDLPSNGTAVSGWHNFVDYVNDLRLPKIVSLPKFRRGFVQTLRDFLLGMNYNDPTTTNQIHSYIF